MGEGVPSDRADHARLILRAMRAGLIEIDDRAEQITFAGQRYRLYLYTDDGSCLTTAAARVLRSALDEA